MAKEKAPRVTLKVGGHDVDVSSPDKVYFPQAGITKLDVARYYIDVAEACLVAVRRRPMILKRYVHGIEKEPFFQKRVQSPPSFIETATFHYRSGGSAEEAVVNDVAGLVWVVNLGCIEMHVHPVRSDDLDHPDELRIDLDPGPGFDWSHVIAVARVVDEVLREVGLTGWPKTSGSRGVHIWARIERRYTYDQVREAALTLALEVERRLPGVATATWQKTERHGVLVDYNQNAKDRTTAAAWSVRAVPDARVSMPLTWNDLFVCTPADFTLRTVPALLRQNGDPHATIDEHAGALEKLLALAPEMAAKQKAKKKAKAKEPADKDAVIVIATAETKAEALAGLERWKARHADIVPLLAADDVIVDTLRGSSSAWWRIRVHLRHVPKEQRPKKEPPDPDWHPDPDRS